MKPIRRQRLLLTILPLLAAVAGHAAEDIVFPPAPEQARYRHLEDLTGQRNFTRPIGWWDKVKSIVGGRRPQSILVRPQGLSLDGSRLLIADPGAGCLHVFDLESRTYSRIPEDSTLPSPVDAVEAGPDIILVADSSLGRVLRYDGSGRRLDDLPQEFQRPTGLAWDAQRQRLYVVDAAASCVKILDAEGRLLSSFGRRGDGAGEFNLPTKISLGADGRIYINDSMNFRIQVFSPTGEYEFQLGLQGDTPGHLARPRGVAVDADDHVYITDAMQDAFQVFAPDGSLLLFVGGRGRQPGRFNLPADIAVSGSLVCVADPYNGRVQVFRYLGD